MALRVWLPLNGNLNNQGLSNITVTNSGATVNDAGKIGKCYSFNSSNSNYLLGLNAPLNNNTLNWSFCCWIKVNSSHSGCIYSNRKVQNSNGIAIFWYSGQFLMDDGTRWQFTPSIAINNNTWYHLCFTRENGIGKKFYVNGVLANSTSTLGTPTNADSTHFVIGASQGSPTVASDNWLDGFLNDVRVYDHCLSPKEVKEMSKGLILHYKLDSLNTSVNNKVCDCSGYKNNGTIIGTLTTASGSLRYNKSLVFDGTTSAIQIVSPNIFPSVLNSDFTISMWIYNNDASGRSIFFGNWGLTGGYFNIEKKTDEKVRFYWSGKPDLTLNNCTLTASAWSHLVITRSGNTVKGYVNGVLKDTSTTTLQDTIPEGATTFRIGMDNRADTTMFKGNMSDFRIYATALPADDIKELYNTSALIHNNGTFECYEIDEVNSGLDINSRGVTETVTFYEEGALDILEYSITGNGATQTPTNNGTNVCTNGYSIVFNDLSVSKKYVIEFDFTWSGTWASGTGGTLNLRFQGANKPTTGTSYVWSGTNYVCSAINSKQNPLTLVNNSPTGGTYHYKCEFTIPANNSYNGFNLGTRCDYSNGNGTLSFGNLKLYKYEASLNTEKVKFGEGYITSKQFNEI